MRCLPKVPLLSQWLRRAEGQPSLSVSVFLPNALTCFIFCSLLRLHHSLWAVTCIPTGFSLSELDEDKKQIPLVHS